MVSLPYALPAIFAGLKVSVTLAVVGAVVGEFVGANSGIGFVLQRSIGNFELPTMFAALVILASSASSCSGSSISSSVCGALAREPAARNLMQPPEPRAERQNRRKHHEQAKLPESRPRRRDGARRALRDGLPAQAADKVVLMINWYVYGEHAPFYYGKEKGIFAAEGIDLEIQEGRGSAVTVQAVAAKTVPFGYADVPTMIRAAVKGAPVVVAGRRAAEEPHVGDGLCREEHPEARGHQGQDRRDDAGRFHVADLAAVP